MKTLLIIISLITNGTIERAETVYSSDTTLSAQIDCQTAAEHFNKISVAKSQSSWAYCVRGEESK